MLVLLYVLMGVLVLIGLFGLFDRPLHKLYLRVSWRRFEKRTGIERPSNWDKPLGPTIHDC